MFEIPLTGDLRDLNLVSILLRFAMAAVCSGVIGFSRGRKQHAAGLRTHLLVCIGAAAVMLTSQYLAVYYQTGDPARLGAQVISGIGFLGAGTIIVTGRNQVRGLTTAAGLWASACMGLAIGSGFYEGAVVMCLLLYFVLVGLSRLDDTYIKNGSVFPVYIEFETQLHFSPILRELRSLHCHVSEIVEMRQEGGSLTCAQLQIIIKKDSGQTKQSVVEFLQEIPGVLFAEEL